MVLPLGFSSADASQLLCPRWHTEQGSWVDPQNEKLGKAPGLWNPAEQQKRRKIGFLFSWKRQREGTPQMQTDFGTSLPFLPFHPLSEASFIPSLPQEAKVQPPSLPLSPAPISAPLCRVIPSSVTSCKLILLLPRHKKAKLCPHPTPFVGAFPLASGPIAHHLTC